VSHEQTCAHCSQVGHTIWRLLLVCANRHSTCSCIPQSRSPTTKFTIRSTTTKKLEECCCCVRDQELEDRQREGNILEERGKTLLPQVK
jgi:hypothetical protein